MMAIEGLIEYTERQLEERSRLYVQRRVDVPRGIPTNVEALLEGIPDVDLEIVPNLTVQYSIEGCVCKQKMSKLLTVFVDKRIADSGSRASYGAVISEELSHIVLHQAIVMQVASIEDFIEVQKCPQWRQLERDAKRFSSALRMPFDAIGRAAAELYPEIVDEHGFGDIQKIEKLLRNRMADRFVVPNDDMQRRLSQWPSDILSRVQVSAQACTDRLAPADSAVKLVKRGMQTRLFPST